MSVSGTATARQAIVCFTAKNVHNAVESKVMSKSFIVNLLKSSILNIMYRRIDIEKSEFITHKYLKIPYVIFKRKSTNKMIRHYHGVIKAILDSLEKNYLKNIFLFMRQHDGEVVETYNFSLKYNKNDNVKVKTDPKEVDQTFIAFFTTINDLDKYQKLNQNDIRVHFEFKYYPETPENYQPPGFRDALAPLCMAFPEANVILGSVSTGFHKVVCHGGGKIFPSVSRCSTPAPSEKAHLTEIDTKNLVSQTALDTNGFSQEDDCLIELSDDGQDEPLAKRTKIMECNITITEQDSTEKTRCSITDRPECPCCHLSLSGEFEMVSCSKCPKKFHILCRGYFEMSAIDETSVRCFYCENPNVDVDRVTLTCRLRLIMYLLIKEGEMPIELLKGMSTASRAVIFAKLKEFEICDVDGPNKTYINKKKLNNAVGTMFQEENSQIFT